MLGRPREPSSGAEGFVSASSSPGGASSEGAPSPAGSIGSVDSHELQALLQELHIVPAPATGKRAHVEGAAPPSQRPQQSPRHHSSSGATSRAPVPPPPADGRRAAATAVAAGAGAAAAAAAAAAATEPEVIEILDSSSEEEEWSIAAPATASKRRGRVIDSDYSEQESQEFDTEESESEEEGSASESDVDYSASEASSGSEEDEGPAAGEPAALPPYFSAIPSLAGAAPPPPQPKPKPPKAAAPPKAARPQQHAAAPPLAQGSSTAGGPAALTAAAFKRQKVELAAQLFAEFNRTIFEGRLPADLAIKWNGRLLTTAGLTHYRRDIPDDPYAPPIYSARVELSAKVVDCWSKLERTLCHELCHVAAWLLDNTAKPPHGPVFKRWASAAMQRYRHLDITTCHAYEIFYPYRWQCTNGECLQTYGRHSNSIDVKKKVCGACRAPLSFLGKFKPDGTPAKQRAPTAYANFVKEHSADIRRQLPAGTPQKEVLSRVAGMWADKQRAAAQAGVAAASAAASGSSEGASSSVVDLTGL